MDGYVYGRFVGQNSRLTVAAELEMQLSATISIGKCSGNWMETHMLHVFGHGSYVVEKMVLVRYVVTVAGTVVVVVVVAVAVAVLVMVAESVSVVETV